MNTTGFDSSYTVFNSGDIFGNETNDTFSTTTAATGYSDRHNREVKIFKAVATVFTKLIIATSVVGIVLQILSLFALKYIKTRFRPMHKFLVSLAVAELIFLLGILVHTVLDVMDIDLNSCASSLFPTLDHMVITAAELSIFGMVIDQYCAICHPLKYPVMINNMVITWILVAVWILSFITSIWQFFSIETLRKLVHGGVICFPEIIDRNWGEVFLPEKFTAHLHMIILLVVIIIIVILYCRIFYVAWKSLRRDSVRRISINSDSSSESRKQLKTALTAFLLFTTLLIFWLPYWVFRIAGLWSHFEGRLPFWIAYIVWGYLIILNPILDTLIYSIRMKEIRKGYCRLFLAACPVLCKRFFSRRMSQDVTSASQPTTTGTKVSTSEMPTDLVTVELLTKNKKN